MVNKLFGLTLFLILFSGAAFVQAEDAWHHNLETAREEAQRLNRPILCHFYADWCVPCQKMERTVLNQPQVLTLLKTSIVGVKINVEDHPELAQRFAVDRFPSDLFIEPDGKGLLSHTGMQSTTEYVGMAQRATTRYMDLIASRQPKAEPPVATTPADTPSLVSQEALKPMLDGYSPVVLWKNRRWEKGSKQFSHVHNGQLFLLSSESEKKEFASNPDRYVPRFLGCDPVVVWESDRAVPGDTTWAAFYDDELFLFSSSDNRIRFKANPDKYTKTRVVLNVGDIETALR